MKKARDQGCSRRGLLKSAALGGALYCVKSVGLWGHKAYGSDRGPIGDAFLIEGIGRGEDKNFCDLMVKKVFEAAGGIGRFVSPGSVVTIKPNISWARRPEYAATTNPEILRSLVELCIDAGARKVLIADNTIHEPGRCFALTGASDIAKSTGAELVHPRPSLFKEATIGGDRIRSWPVLVPFLETDAIINVPVLKHHSLTGITAAMKNWIGAVGGSRWILHQDIHQSIVDLARFFKPTVTLIDATRILTQNGPSGGDLKAVSQLNRVILSNDQVAADSRAALLFGIAPQEIRYIELGEKQGLGLMNLPSERVKTVTL